MKLQTKIRQFLNVSKCNICFIHCGRLIKMPINLQNISNRLQLVSIAINTALASSLVHICRSKN